MATPYSNKYSLYLRGSIYWMSVQTRTGRVRKTLKTTDLDVATSRAEALIAAYGFSLGTTAMRRPAIDGETWAEHVTIAQPGDTHHWLSLLYRSCRSRIKFRGKPFGLSFSELKHLAICSGGYCAVTGTPLEPYPPKSQRVHPFQPSLDRINSKKGYTFSNCRIVCYAANLAMNEWGEGPLETMMLHMATTAFNKKRAPFTTQHLKVVS